MPQGAPPYRTKFLTEVQTIVLRVLCALWLLGLSLASPVGAEPQSWITLEQGLDYAEFSRNDGTSGTVVFLRFDPKAFTFALHSISEQGGPALTLHQWADKHHLVAAINASMYLTDGSTSTGYMRHGEHVNSKRIVNRFGAFFVAELREAKNLGPVTASEAEAIAKMAHALEPDASPPAPEGVEDLPALSPPATLLDRDMDPWQTELPKYVTVVQNYRMINGQRRVLWSPGGPLYSISAIGKDGAGNILFIHCREPIEAFKFATLLLQLPIDIRTVMYVEGGAQAGLLVNTHAYTKTWAGRSPMDFLITGNIKAPLPNVLGVMRRASVNAVEAPASATPDTAPVIRPTLSQQDSNTLRLPPLPPLKPPARKPMGFKLSSIL